MNWSTWYLLNLPRPVLLAMAAHVFLAKELQVLPLPLLNLLVAEVQQPLVASLTTVLANLIQENDAHLRWNCIWSGCCKAAFLTGSLIFRTALSIFLLASSFVIPWGPPSVYPRLWMLATLSFRPCSLLRAAFDRLFLYVSLIGLLVVILTTLARIPGLPRILVAVMFKSS